MLENIKIYLDHHKKLVLTDVENPKKPSIKNWNSPDYATPPLSTIEKHKGGLAWVLSDNDLVIDVDQRNNGFTSIQKLIKDAEKRDKNFKMSASVKTKGGYHIYYKLSSSQDAAKIKKNIKEYEGIDFLKKGCVCAIVGKIESYQWMADVKPDYEKPSKDYFPQYELPDALYQIITESEQDLKPIPKESDKNKDEKIAKITMDEVREKICLVDPNLGYNDWIKVGMAIHSFDSSSEGLELWDSWSSGGDTYKSGECERKWKSFSGNPGGNITILSLFYKISNEEIPLLEKDNNKNQEKLNDTRNSRQFDAIYKNDEAKFKRWIYLSNLNKVGDLETKDIYAPNVWSCMFFGGDSCNYLLGQAIQKGWVRVAQSPCYLPFDKRALVPHHDDPKTIYFNTFSPDSLPVAHEYTEEGQKYIKTFVKHIGLLCNSHVDGDTNAKLLLQWMAWQVQYMGKQLRWCPLIISGQGYGKGFLRSVLSAVLGSKNVGEVKNYMMNRGFNSWAIGKSVNVFEEFVVSGTDRSMLTTIYKTHISDPFVDVHRKGENSFTTYNATNYIAFTNEDLPAQLLNGDRRFWVIKNRFKDKEEIAAHHGMSNQALFTYLFTNLERFKHQMKKWLSEYKITEEFKRLGHAPITSDKINMIQSGKENISYYLETQETLEKGGLYFDTEVVSVKHLFEQVATDHYRLPNITNHEKNKLLRAMNYVRHPKRLWSDEGNLVIYTKKEMTIEEVKKRLEDQKKLNDECLLSQVEQEEMDACTEVEKKEQVINHTHPEEIQRRMAAISGK